MKTIKHDAQYNEAMDLADKVIHSDYLPDYGGGLVKVKKEAPFQRNLF